MTVRVGPANVTLNGLWRIRWDEVRAAKLLMVLGQPHLRLWTTKGAFRRVPVSVPLHYIGHPDLSILLRDILPSENPARACLEQPQAPDEKGGSVNNMEKLLGAILVAVGLALLFIHPASRLQMIIGGALVGVGVVAPWLVKIKLR